jgi:hypothetical protein
MPWASQEWPEPLGDPTLADAILDRLSHNAHRIELRGDSLRRSDNRDQLISAAPTASEAPPPTPDPARPEKRAAGRAAETRKLAPVTSRTPKN